MVSTAARLLEQGGPEIAPERFRDFAEAAAVNLIFCGPDLTIAECNRAAVAELRQIENHLPCRVEALAGQRLDAIFPGIDTATLLQRRRDQIQQVINVGPEHVDVTCNLVFGENGEQQGAVVRWDLITAAQEQRVAMGRMRSMVENAPINMMMADRDLNLVYMNDASRNTLRQIEDKLPRPVDELLGESIDIFHKDPAVQRRLLANDRNLPHRAVIRLGDEYLDLLVAAAYDDERNYIGPMVTWDIITNKMVLVENIKEAAQALSAAAEQMNATSTQMSANSEETSAQSNNAAHFSQEVSKGFDAVSVNMEEMQGAIKEISTNATQASSMSSATRTQADTTNGQIQKLGESSNEIGKVIKVISSIAQQTNLLALNATIEAARAGDAGRGFAVVANEVKELAKQTATATEDITSKIGAIQSDTSEAVSAIEKISTSIAKLNDISGSIAASIEQQAATSQEISRVVDESNRGVQNITENIKNVSTAASETSAGAGQIMTAAKSLSDLALRLNQLVRDIEV